jgi:hypothetical protein
MVEGLPPTARRRWNQASTRIFDIGIQAGLSPYAFEGVTLGEGTLRAIARIGGRVLLTVYAPRAEE